MSFDPDHPLRALSDALHMSMGAVLRLHPEGLDEFLDALMKLPSRETVTLHVFDTASCQHLAGDALPLLSSQDRFELRRAVVGRYAPELSSHSTAHVELQHSLVIALIPK